MRSATKRIGPIALLALLGFMRPVIAQDAETPEYTGRDIYRLFCIVCHASRGQGTPLGASIVTVEAIARPDNEVIDVIANGRADTGMTGFASGLSREEIVRVAQYVRELQNKRSGRVKRKARSTPMRTAGPTPGEIKGEKLFHDAAGCIRCHSYFAQGGLIGPNLDKLADRLTREEIEEAVTNPSATITVGYAAMELVTADGRTIRGVVRRETEETVQMLNEDGSLWITYFKKDLKELRGLEESLMPAEPAAKLSKADRAALFAFLETLK